jgi:hypothetical protein
MKTYIYVPSDVPEAAEFLGAKAVPVHRTDYFDKEYELQTEQGSMVGREVNVQYGEHLRKRYGFRFSPMSVFEIPEESHRIKEGLIRAIVKGWGWVAEINGKGVIQHPKDKK